MGWLTQLIQGSSVAQVVIVLSAVIAAGLALGSVRVGRVGLGIAGVLFAGLAFGHVLGRADVGLDAHLLEFVREFGLIVFVYGIGMQVGPGFFSSLRRQGLSLNLLAAGVVLMSVAVVVAIHLAGLVPLPVAMGLFSGATTNTPSLAAAQQALRDLSVGGGGAVEAATVPGLAYAVAYPFGIIGIILTMLLVRAVFRIDPKREADLHDRLSAAGRAALSAVNLEVRNPNLDGLPLSRVPTLRDGGGAVVSRVSRGGRATVGGPETVLAVGDVLHAVGTPDRLDELRLVVGADSPVDVKAVPGDVASRRIIVTRRGAVGRTLVEIGLRDRLGVNVTRINRAGVELPPAPGLRLQFADRLVAVGSPAALKAAAAELGDSQAALDHPQVLPVFVGIMLGVIVGSWPLTLPGMPAPVKLGLAGGPLVVAILLSRLGNVGPLVWYLPVSANTMLRELGIVLFLAAVGLRAGARFVDTVLTGDGLVWMGLGAVITLVPLLAVAFVARGVLKLNYLSACGLLAGSMTDPPALAFAQSMTGSHAASISYATVYPLVMILRVLAVQVMVLVLAG